MLSGALRAWAATWTKVGEGVSRCEPPTDPSPQPPPSRGGGVVCGSWSGTAMTRTQSRNRLVEQGRQFRRMLVVRHEPG